MGAWIETDNALKLLQYLGVAPRVGAWIETADISTVANTNMSPLAWGRGLKLLISLPLLILICRPSRGGVD